MSAANFRKSLGISWLPAVTLAFGLAATGLSIQSYMDKKSAEADPDLRSKLYNDFYNTPCKSLMATQYHVKDGVNEFTIKSPAREDDLRTCAETYTHLKITMIKEAPTINAIFAAVFFFLAGAEALVARELGKTDKKQPPTPRAAP